MNSRNQGHDFHSCLGPGRSAATAYDPVARHCGHLSGPDRRGLDGLHHKLAISLTTNRPLKVKFGMDPTAPDLHLGHRVVLKGMRRFQELGHIAQPHIGDYTARIGGPSGRNKTPAAAQRRADRCKCSDLLRAGVLILDSNSDRHELLYNGQWLSKLSFAETIKLCAQVTVAQIPPVGQYANLHARAYLSDHARLRFGHDELRR